MLTYKMAPPKKTKKFFGSLRQQGFFCLIFYCNSSLWLLDRRLWREISFYRSWMFSVFTSHSDSFGFNYGHGLLNTLPLNFRVRCNLGLCCGEGWQRILQLSFLGSLEIFSFSWLGYVFDGLGRFYLLI